jgi:hypothetical protein
VRSKVTLYATVGQHRGNGTLRPDDSPPLSIQCDEGDQDVAIDGLPASIHNDAAVSVTIKRDAEVGAVRAHLLAECGGVGGANAVIDDASPHGERQDGGTSSGERRNGEWRSGTMCRINHHT